MIYLDDASIKIPEEFSIMWEKEKPSLTKRKKKKRKKNQTGGSPVTPALGRLKQEDQEFKASLGFMVSACLKDKNKQEIKCSYYIVL
jgi:hypothetical protein